MSATDTKFGESAQALFCAIADIVGLSKAPKVLDLKKYTNYVEFEADNRKIIDQAYKAIDTPGASLDGIEEFLKRPSDKNGWYRSSVLIALKLLQDITKLMSNLGYTKFNKFQTPGINNLFYKRGDNPIMGNIEKLFKIANKNTKYWNTLGQPSFGDINKWNPADMYFASDTAKNNVNKELSFAQSNQGSYNIDRLNILITENMKSGDLFPLSLKKQTKQVDLQPVNFDQQSKAEILKNVKYKDIYKVESKAGKVWFTPKDPQRDMLLGVVDNKGGDKGKIQIRHEPSAGQWKVDFTYRGAQARGGSLTSFDAFSKLIGQHNAKVGAEFLKQYKIGNDLFKAQNKIHEKTKAEFRNKYGKEAYDKRRGELSATTIINRVMPVISSWLAKEKQEVKTEFIRSIFTYVTSRAPKSGKFVIAK
tara:strand:- start:1898 stop:3157 length:1260 start_codon:yes stop_codon:yes gene_type:complete